MPRTRTAAALLAFALLFAACTGDTTDPEPTDPPTTTVAAQDLQAFVASYDLSADRPSRVMVGLVSQDGRVVSYGEVGFAFSYLGRTQAEGTPEPGPDATAAFLPVPGEDVPPGEGPIFTAASEARGVYAATGVELNRAGLWQVDVTAEIDGEALTGSGTFPVLETAQAPVPGDDALKTMNHLPGAEGIPPGAIDSRAEQPGEVPDPILHRETIARAVNQKRPALVLFATPVYCVSRFCGPITDVVEDLARAHQGDAAFIHVEIWKDFQNQVINKAAADWIGDPTQGETLQEPWLFLIGRDGKVLARWDNLFSIPEVEDALADATN